MEDFGEKLRVLKVLAFNLKKSKFSKNTRIIEIQGPQVAVAEVRRQGSKCTVRCPKTSKALFFFTSSFLVVNFELLCILFVAEIDRISMKSWLLLNVKVFMCVDEM